MILMGPKKDKSLNKKNKNNIAESNNSNEISKSVNENTAMNSHDSIETIENKLKLSDAEIPKDIHKENESTDLNAIDSSDSIEEIVSLSGEIIDNSEEGSDEDLSDYQADLSEFFIDENGNNILDYMSILNKELSNNTKLMKGVRKDIGRIADCLEKFTKIYKDIKVNN